MLRFIPAWPRVILVNVFRECHIPCTLKISVVDYGCFLVGFMVFNATFNNISVISWLSVLLMEDLEKNTNLLYTSTWSRFELTTSVVIGTDCIISCKTNYHTITTRRPLVEYEKEYCRHYKRLNVSSLPSPYFSSGIQNPLPLNVHPGLSPLWILYIVELVSLLNIELVTMISQNGRRHLTNTV